MDAPRPSITFCGWSQKCVQPAIQYSPGYVYRMDKASYWLLTINNPTAEDRKELKDPVELIRQAWYQDEIGQEGTLHIQACLNTKQCRFAAIKAIFPRAHIEAARNAMACKQYCQKSKSSVEGTFQFFTRSPRVENTIEEPQENPMLATLHIMLSALPYDYLAKSTEEVYLEVLNDLVSSHPEMVERLTQQRIRTAFCSALIGLTKNYQTYLCEFGLDMPDEEPLSSHPECVIDKHQIKGEWCMGCSDC